MLTTLAIKDVNSQIEAINQQMLALKQQIDSAKSEKRRLADTRDKLNEKFKKIQQEIHDLKTERNALNEEARILKILRDETKSKAATLIVELKSTYEKIRELKTKTPKRSNSELQEELDRIEWKIQTTSLEAAAEKELIEKVKQLETQQRTYKKIEEQRKKIKESRRNIEAIDKQATTAHNQLQCVAKKSQELHSKMMLRIEESKKIKADADSMHSIYVQAKTKTELAIQEYTRLAEQRKMVQKTIENEEETKRKIKQQELKEKIVSEARDKLQKGEKLNWNEFQLLNENASQTQD